MEVQKLYTPSRSIHSSSHHATRISPSRPKKRVYPTQKPQNVYFFGTCIIDLLFPNAGMDAIQVLELEGMRVHFPQNQSCCGQPAYSSGYRNDAKEVAKAQLCVFPENWPIIVPSGSCAGMMRHHYKALFADEPELRKQVSSFSDRIYEFGEFLLYVAKVNLKDQGKPIKIALHTSCAARREMDTHLHVRALLAQLEHVTRIDHESESECCGFGGTFSVKMADISGAMVKDKIKSLEDTGAKSVVSADCGCLMNINGAFEKQKRPLRGQHLATFLLTRIQGKVYE